MAKTLTITLPDNLEEELTAQAARLNQSPEAILLQALTRQLKILSEVSLLPVIETDPLLRLIGSIDVDIPDLAENCDHYIGQDLYQELKVDG
ncbi:hypothetical protein [Pseudanabaena yagii]|uniref:Ribbon-helix-helix protein CopG domain-containing protein n=1 Tax=Pseudanabaena yagii GIHE-NHR1 TaxID=2722753 RepID=A0ABX1LYD6_9CYAN|nr:hypothetical protein [Pseudanabaena yagii]NMF58887.1 hypothetical protein [Pseudanabaena yagii GIHE-NHR1]